MTTRLASERIEKAHKTVSGFLSLLRDGYGDRLLEFGVVPDIYDEIVEVLSGFDIDLGAWTLPPLHFVGAQKVRIFDLFERDISTELGFESELWANEKRQEPIIHGHFIDSLDLENFKFDYIGS